MMNHETYRAVFEGLQAHMWTKNSGRLLWMTHPAWPSNHWQIYGHDYDTHASYYGVKKATEPLHAQLNLPDYSLSVVNVTRNAHAGLKLISEVRTLDNRLLAHREDQIDAGANSAVHAPALQLLPLLQEHGVVIVRLELRDGGGRLITDNTYVESKDDASQRQLNALPRQALAAKASTRRVDDEHIARVQVTNRGKSPALSVKLTVVDGNGTRILPALYSDNYFAVLPGESRDIEIRYPATSAARAAVRIRGWNVEPKSVSISGTR